MSFVVTAWALSRWHVTRWAGHIMEGRVNNLLDNWQRHTLRSFAEIMLWLCAILRCYLFTSNACLSLLVGTACGIVTVVAGERYALVIQGVEHDMLHGQEEEEHGGKRGCCGEMPRHGVLHAPWLIGFVLLMISHFKAFRRDLLVGTMLSLFTCVSFVTCCQLFLAWRPTHTAGVVLQGRVINAVDNWRAHTLRSALELGFYVGAICMTWATLQDPFVAVAVATLCGVVTCLLSEALSEFAVRMFTMEPASRLEREREREPVQEPVLLPLCMCANGGALALYMVFNHLQNTVRRARAQPAFGAKPPGPSVLPTLVAIFRHTLGRPSFLPHRLPRSRFAAGRGWCWCWCYCLLIAGAGAANCCSAAGAAALLTGGRGVHHDGAPLPAAALHALHRPVASYPATRPSFLPESPRDRTDGSHRAPARHSRASPCVGLE